MSNYPQFPEGFRVWIEGQCFRAGAVAMFAKAGCKAANSPEESDLVVFLGGEDIDPALYGEKKHHKTGGCNIRRDERECDLFDKCVENNIPMFGICRGMQFIHARTGNKLYQHVLGHAAGPHLIVDVETGEKILATSMHHQMCIESPTIIPLAYAVEGTTQGAVYEYYGGAIHNATHKDLEAAIYLEFRAIAVQGHPEVASGRTEEYTVWCINRILDFLVELKAMDRIVETKQSITSVTTKEIPAEIVEECLKTA